jgi:hypothetical protein
MNRLLMVITVAAVVAVMIFFFINRQAAKRVAGKRKRVREKNRAARSGPRQNSSQSLNPGEDEH